MIIETIQEKLTELLTNSTATIVTATATTSMGAISKLSENQPLISDVLGDISMIVGIIACIALTRVHILRGNRLSREENNGPE
jgi:hypothetical protein